MGKARGRKGFWPAGGLGVRARKRARGESLARFKKMGGRGDAGRVAWVRQAAQGRGAPKAGPAQTILMLQCMATIPNKKKVLRAWAQGARFDHEPTEDWPGMYLSSVQLRLFPARGPDGQPEGGSEREWLWDAMAREGADLEQTDSEGLGFELLAARRGDDAALVWWSKKGRGIGRRAPNGDSAWGLAFRTGSHTMATMARLWPEAADPKSVSGEVYASARRAARERSGSPMMMAAIARGWREGLRAWPELTQPTSELSGLMRDAGVAQESVVAMERLEREALAKAESEELDGVAAAATARPAGRAGL